MYDQNHAAGWKRVVDCVHNKNGVVCLQMTHWSRQGHSSFNDVRDEIVAPSSIAFEAGHTRDVNENTVHFETPRALQIEEIVAVVEDYRRCAELAKQSGFDGVEIHAGGGFLVDLFLQPSTNERTGEYGGSFANRFRFLLEIVGAVKTVFASDRIAVFLSSNSAVRGMGSDDNVEMFTFVMEQLRAHNLVYLAIHDGAGVAGLQARLVVVAVRRACSQRSMPRWRSRARSWPPTATRATWGEVQSAAARSTL